MDHEGYVSKVAIGVITMWGTVFVLLFAAWVVLLVASHVWPVGVMLAATSCVLAGFTSTIHNRLYVARVCGVIRATSSLESEVGPAVRSVR